ncbi:TlpA family protein disulfide reductase [Echinicola soli]|uniref:TlpA family protein disulfide reductase n=1 Tax=Echinicola soli TaxID=2591634 RepID=A0A514CLV6_9BACT|nr:TlpA disulfide reductase family protein [Echinicola soli]QDH80780.1 TlpA family protein disulfide reductase [Echinicola soli]
MKTLFLLFLTIITSSYHSFSQNTVIENPIHGGTTSPYVKITQLELRDTTTVLHFRVTYRPGWWINVSSSETHIKNSTGGEGHYVQKAEGINLDEKHTMDESGVHQYTLYFPALEKGTEKIDFLEEQWKIYDIHLTASPVSTSPIPEALLGNWIRTDGSNEWVYGFDKDKLIMDGQVFPIHAVNVQNSKGEITYKANGITNSLYYQKNKDGKIGIGKTPNSLELFSQTLTNSPDYSLDNDEFFQEPIFQKDSATYKGYLKGYHPKMGMTGKVYLNNILTRDQEGYEVIIKSDGTFHAKFPMIYPEQAFIRILGNSHTVYFEPGKTTFEFIDLTTHSMLKYDKSRYQETTGYRFMGDNAKVNTDLEGMSDIQNFDFNYVQSNILDMEKEAYKAYCLDILNKDMEDFNTYVNTHQVSEKARFIMEKFIKFNIYSQIMTYNMYRSSIHRRKNREAKPLERTMLDSSYLSFLRDIDLNSPSNLVATNFDGLVNRVMYSNIIRGQEFSNPYENLEAEMNKNEIPLTEEQRSAIKSISEASSYDELDSTLKSNKPVTDPLFSAHKTLITILQLSNSHQKITDRLEKSLGIKEGLFADCMLSKEIYAKSKSTYTPYSNEEEKVIPSLFENRFIADYFLETNQDFKKEIASIEEKNKSAEGYHINEIPEVNADQLFETMMAQFKGKVVYVDFWATWCGPCISGIKQIAPLKEEMKDEDVVFVYITDQSSPEKLWNFKVPGIKGEHFRVNNDQWNILSQKFQISGIPHYVLVDKDGKVVRNNFRISNAETKKLIEEHLN